MAIDFPTSRADWRLAGRAVRLVLGHPGYGALAFAVGLVAAVAMSLSTNLRFNLDVVLFGDLPLETRLVAVALQLPLVGPAFDPVRGLFVYATAALVGANVALLVYHLRAHDLSARGGSGSAAGVLFGTLGAGCAACGPAILAGVLGLVGGTALLAALPLDGLEFSALAVVVLLLSTYWLADGMRGGEIRGCPVDGESGRS